MGHDSSKGAPWDLTPFSQSPSAAPSYFPESHWQSEISSLSKVILVLGKARSHRAPNLGCRGTELPGRFGVSPKNCMRRDVCTGTLWWSCQSPVAHSCGLLNYPNIVSTEEWMFKLNINKICADYTCSVILNMTATQYTCSFSGLYHPHCLIQWSCHCSRMHIPVHSPWLPGDIDVTQIISLY